MKEIISTSEKEEKEEKTEIEPIDEEELKKIKPAGEFQLHVNKK